MKLISDRPFVLEALGRVAAPWFAIIIVTSAVAAPAAAPSLGEQFSLQQALSFPTTSDLVASKVGNRIAWVLDERGVRNVWGAEGPAWFPHPLTQFASDDGKEITQLSLSVDGSLAVFVRNEGEGNWSSPTGTHPNPASLPVAQKVEIWIAPFEAARARKVAEGTSPAFSPDGKRVAFVRDGQAYIVATEGATSAAEQLFYARGTTGSLAWSPDGSSLAFISSRGPLSLLGVYRSVAERVLWIAPASNHVASPRWSPDGKQLAFVRLPGTGGPIRPRLERHPAPFELWVADTTSGEGHAIWRSPRILPESYPDVVGEFNLSWGAGDRLVFAAHLGDGWLHLYSVQVAGGEPTLLTPGPFMVEEVSLSPDRKTIVYNANTGSDPGDDDRRHLFRVALDHPGPTQITMGAGIEWNPVVTSDSQTVAFIGAATKRPPLPAIMSLSGGAAKPISGDRVPGDFPEAAFVEPRKVTFQASDGVQLHGQLFDYGVPHAGVRPAIIFVHGGPERQMLLGFHYIPYYARDYAVNQYLASRGFVVLSLNYRLGIGYGDAFENPESAGTKGASEFLDVLAANAYLRTLPGVDSKRIGIWGGSYGGYLTALALARRSDLFAAGVDINGVHNWLTLSEEEGDFPAGMWRERQRPPDYAKALDVEWQSSPIADAAHWQSPVLFIHGDDDRNVDVAQTIDMAEYLRARDVRFEELIIPDETHGWSLYSSWLKVATATSAFLIQELGPLPVGK